MKQLFTFLLLALMSGIIAQAPPSIPYQAVVRNTDGLVMANTSISMTFRIHDNTATGTVVYEENHSTTSNAQGLISINVGNGSVVSGSFSEINWGVGSKYLNVLMNAGNGNVDLGTQQMMSVPYALHANDINVRVSNVGDSLFIGGDYSIIPGLSMSNSVSSSSYGSSLLPGNTTCESQYISVTGCGGAYNIFYNERYYSLVEINGQCWFAENLSTEKYSNGDIIQTGLSSNEWLSASAGAYAVYGDSLINDSLYGKLYNWYTTVDSRGVCPTGWHVPSDCEWMFLENSVGLSIIEQQDTINALYRGTTEGGALKKISGWKPSTTGFATNSTGFSALPGGWLSQVSTSYSINQAGVWWSTSLYPSPYYSYIRGLLNSSGQIYRGLYYLHSGASIRCLKD